MCEALGLAPSTGMEKQNPYNPKVQNIALKLPFAVTYFLKDYICSKARSKSHRECAFYEQQFRGTKLNRRKLPLQLWQAAFERARSEEVGTSPGFRED